MTAKVIITTIVVAVAWSVMDMVIHGQLLMPAYEETASLWRPEAEFKMVSMYLSVLIAAAMFVAIFAYLFGEKNLRTGLIYGLLMGIGWGAAFGYGSYSYMPIPYFLAQAWFWATVVEMLVAGAIVGLILKD